MQIKIPRSRLRRIVLALAVILILTFAFSPQRSILEKADAVGFAVCHRIDFRSFHMQGRQLPLCVRCTGTYLGVFAGLGAFWLRGRRRAAGFPPVSVLAALVGFWALFGIDGLNSYLALLGAPHLYEPHHLLRILTGSLNGMALTILVWPVFNFSLWKETDSLPVVRNLRELGAIVAVAWALALVVYAEPSFLLYPVALLSSFGVLFMLTLVNSLVVLAVMRREASAVTWRDAVLPLTLGLAMALLEIALLNFVRFNILPPLPF